MSETHKDALLTFGQLLARFLQGACVLAGGIAVLLIPVVLLASQGVMPGFGGAGRSGSIAASPPSVVAIVACLALIFAALFLFFGKLRAIIASAGEGDPFTPDNAGRLETMAWLFLGVKMLTIVVTGLRHHVATLMNNGASSDRVLGFGLFDVDAFLIVIVLFILARIFRHGTAIRDDLSGTV